MTSNRYNNIMLYVNNIEILQIYSCMQLPRFESDESVKTYVYIRNPLLI